MAAAEDFVHLYVDELRWLRIFLTYVLREGGRAGSAVADTLLELLLREWAEAGAGAGKGGAAGGGDGGAGLAAKKQREDEVMALLDNPRAGYDADHALVLVQMLNFKPGQLYLYEKVRDAWGGLRGVGVVVMGRGELDAGGSGIVGKGFAAGFCCCCCCPPRLFRSWRCERCLTCFGVKPHQLSTAWTVKRWMRGVG